MRIERVIYAVIALVRVSSIVAAILALGLFVPVPGEAGAEVRDPVKLKIDGGFRYLWEQGLAIFDGRVEFEYGDVTVTSDRAVIDVNNNKGEFSGNVVVRSDSQQITGDYFEYDLNAETGRFTGAKAVLTGEGIKGNVFLLGQEVETTPGAVFVHKGSLTTCDLEEPHYHLEARELELYIDQKIVVRGVTYYEGKIPLFYWPYLVIPIKTQNYFQLPRFGYSDATGWYVKTTYNYYRHPENYGLIYLDHFARLGFGTGFKHYYKDDETGIGWITGYFLQDRGEPSGSLSAGWGSQFSISNGYDVSASVDYESSAGETGGVTNKRLGTEVDLTGETEKMSASASVDYAVISGDLNGTELSGDLKLRYELSPSWQIAADASVIDNHYVEENGKKEIDYIAAVKKFGKGYSYSLSAQQRLNPELDEVSTPQWRSVSRLPELVFELYELEPLKGVWPIGLEVIAGNYEEQPSGTGAKRLEIAAEGKRRSARLTPKLSVYGLGSAVFDAYDTGEKRFAWDGEAGLRYTPVKPLSFSFSYYDREVFGSTPFYFDRVSPAEGLTGRVDISLSPVTASLSGGYDLRSGEFQDLRAALNAGGQRWRLGLGTSYSFEQESLTYATALTEIAPAEDWTIKLGARYDFLDQSLDRIDGEIAMELAEGWRVSYSAIYDGTQSKYLKGDFSLTRDLHCRELTLRYNQAEGEIWLEYTIDAFPSGKVKVGTSEERMMFEAEGWEELFE